MQCVHGVFTKACNLYLLVFLMFSKQLKKICKDSTFAVFIIVQLACHFSRQLTCNRQNVYLISDIHFGFT